MAQECDFSVTTAAPAVDLLVQRLVVEAGNPFLSPARAPGSIFFRSTFAFLTTQKLGSANLDARQSLRSPHDSDSQALASVARAHDKEVLVGGFLPW